MPDKTPSSEERAAAPRALRRALEERGFDVQSDTLGSRGELYIMGRGDLAIALFEFKTDVVEAIDSMYQGAWVEGLPPRFAVLPQRAAEHEAFEMLEQMHITPLLYRAGDEIVFVDLDRVLDEALRP